MRSVLLLSLYHCCVYKDSVDVFYCTTSERGELDFACGPALSHTHSIMDLTDLILIKRHSVFPCLHAEKVKVIIICTECSGCEETKTSRQRQSLSSIKTSDSRVKRNKVQKGD